MASCNADTTCRYCWRSPEAYHGTGPHDLTPTTVYCCTWADNSPAGVAALTNAPRWLQRNALPGHLMREGDCIACPAREEI